MILLDVIGEKRETILFDTNIGPKIGPILIERDIYHLSRVIVGDIGQ